MADEGKTTLYEKLTGAPGKALTSGAVTAGTLIAMRKALGTRAARAITSKVFERASRLPLKRNRQLELGFGPSTRANAAINKTLASGGLLSKGSIGTATALGAGLSGLTAKFERKAYADNLAHKIQAGKKLSRSEKEALSRVADIRRFPKRSRIKSTGLQKAEDIYWSPKKMGLTAAAITAVMPGSALARAGGAVLNSSTSAADTKYRGFIMAKALRDRLDKKRKLLPSERRLLKTIQGLGASNA